MRFRFFKTALIIAIAMLAALAYPMYAWGTPEVLEAFIAAGIIALLNVIAGAAILEYAIDKSNGVFLASSFGGMAIRMVLILLTFAFLIVNGYHQMALTFALMGFYLIFMIAEIIYITRELSRRKSQANALRRPVRRQHISSRMASAEQRSS